MQRRTTLIANILLSIAIAGWVCGCEDNKTIGSGCPDGVCPLVRANNDDACRVSQVQVAIAVSTTDGPDDRRLEGVCLPHAVPVVDGLVNARVVYVLPQESAMRCTDFSFLEPAGADLRDAYAGSYPDRQLCELNQLVVTQDDDGGPALAAGDGFYFDDFTPEVKVDCSAPYSHGQLAFTRDARPWNDVTVLVSVGDVRQPDGTVSDVLQCEARKGSAPVGTACLPEKHATYDGSETVIETRSEACGDGLCMVSQLQGDTSPKCTKNCADNSEIERRAYCTCRCDAPQGSADLCACGEGYSCVPTIVDAEPGMAGSYCVKDGTFTQ